MRRINAISLSLLPFLLFFLIKPPSACYAGTPELTEYGIFAVSHGNPIKLQGLGGLYISRPEYKLKDKGGVPDILVLNDKKVYFIVSSPFPAYFSEQKGPLFELQYYDSKAISYTTIVHTYRSKREIKCSVKGVEASQWDPKEGRQGRFTYTLTPKERLTDGVYVLDLDESYYPVRISVSKEESRWEEEREYVSAEKQFDKKAHSELKPAEVVRLFATALNDGDYSTIEKICYPGFHEEIWNVDLLNADFICEKIAGNDAVIMYQATRYRSYESLNGRLTSRDNPYRCYSFVWLYKTRSGWVIYGDGEVDQSNVPKEGCKEYLEKNIRALKSEGYLDEQKLLTKFPRLKEWDGPARPEGTKITVLESAKKQEIQPQKAFATDVQTLPTGSPIYLKPGEKPVSSVNAFQEVKGVYPSYLTADGKYIGILYVIEDSAEKGCLYYTWSLDRGKSWKTKFLDEKVNLWILGETLKDKIYFVYMQGGQRFDDTFEVPNRLIFRVINQEGQDVKPPVEVVSSSPRKIKAPASFFIDGEGVYLLYSVAKEESEEVSEVCLLEGSKLGEDWRVLWRSLGGSIGIRGTPLAGTSFVVRDDIHCLYYDEDKKVTRHIIGENKGEKWYEGEPLDIGPAWSCARAVTKKDNVFLILSSGVIVKSEDGLKSWQETDMDVMMYVPLFFFDWNKYWKVVSPSFEGKKVFTIRSGEESWKLLSLDVPGVDIGAVYPKLEGNELHLTYSCKIEDQRFLVYTHLSLKEFYKELEKADIKEGDLIQDKEGLIYLVEKNERRKIPDDETLEILGLNMNNIKRVDSWLALGSVPISSNIPKLADGILVVSRDFQLTSKGDFQEMKEDASIYVIKNHRKHLIPNKDTAEMLGYDIKLAKVEKGVNYYGLLEGEPYYKLKATVLENGLLERISTGPPLPSLSDNSIVRAKESSLTYIIEDKKRRFIPNVYTLEIMGHKETQIAMVEDSLLDRIPLGESLPKLQDGDLVKMRDSDAIYSLQDKKKCFISNLYALAEMGYSVSQAKTIETTLLDKIPIGAPVITKLNERTPVRAEGTTEVYVLENNQKKLIPSPLTLLAIGYEESQIVDVKQDTLNRIQTGAPLLKLERGDLVTNKDGRHIYLLKERSKHVVSSFYALAEPSAWEVLTETKPLKTVSDTYSKTIDNTFLNNIPTGDAITISPLIEGAPVRTKGDTKVYILTNLQKRLIPGSNTLQAMGINESQIVEVEEGVLDRIETGPQVPTTTTSLEEVLVPRKEAVTTQQQPFSNVEVPTKREGEDREKVSEDKPYLVRKKEWVDTTTTERVWVPEHWEGNRKIEGHYVMKVVPGGHWKETIETPAEEEVTTQQRPFVYTPRPYTGEVYAAQGSRTFHRPGCPEIDDQEGLVSFSSASDAVQAGGIACDTCKPLPEGLQQPRPKEPPKDTFGEVMEAIGELFGGPKRK